MVVASIRSAVACVRLVVVVVVAPAEAEALFVEDDVEASSSHLRTRSEEAHPLLPLRIAAQPPRRADVVVVAAAELALLVPLACCFDSSGLSVPSSSSESSSFRFGDELTALMLLVARKTQQQRQRYSRIARETATLPWTEYSLLLLVVAVRAKRRLCSSRRRRSVQREILFEGRTGHHLRSRRSPSLFSWTLRERFESKSDQMIDDDDASATILREIDRSIDREK